MTMNMDTKRIQRIAESVMADFGPQYRSLNDAAKAQGLTELEKGNTAIYYWKNSFARDALMGYDWLKERGLLPTPETVRKNYVLLGKVYGRGMDELYRTLQGEIWSPNGEANKLIRSRGLGHTSMSVGDIVWKGNKAWIVDRIGFEEIW